MDFTTNYRSIYLKYVSVLLCFIMVLLIGNSGRDKKDTKLLQLAFCFTVIADFFMVILDYNTIGVFLFCFVQATYIVRHSRGAKKKCRLGTIIICIILIASVVKLVISNLNIINVSQDGISEKLIIIGSVYLFLLCCSLSTAWKTINGQFYPKYSSFFIAIGMTMFFLCDINVGISVITNDIIVNGAQLGRVSRFLVWVFYLPSQVLLALSGYLRFK